MKSAISAITLVIFATCIQAQPTPPAREHTSIPQDQSRAGAKRCPPTVGSRIVRRGSACDDGVNARQYSRDELWATGETDLSRALQKLDPAVSRRR